MTREEAKDYIREWCPYDRQEEIIKALSNSDEDCISRAEAIKAIRNYNVTIEVGRAIGKSQLADIVDSINKVQEKMISELPSIQPKPKIDVLDEIRAEIKEESRFCPLTEGLERALEIIDKYTAESEDKK